MDARPFVETSREKIARMNEFLDFWALYPRRVSRKDAELAWSKLTPEQKFAAVESLPVHVRYWEVSGTTKEYLPYPGTWLRGERWQDELEMPKPKSENDWWRSTAGIEAKARELGMWPPSAGEDWHSLKARLMAKAA
jgi:hypothetical protein